MAVTTGNSSTAKTTGATSLTWSHNNNGDAVIVGVAGYIPGGQTVTGVTYAGTAMTSIDSQVDGASDLAHAWKLANAATGANNVVASFSGSIAAVCGAQSFAGAHLTTASLTSGVVKTSGNGLTTSQDVTSATGDYVMDIIAQYQAVDVAGLGQAEGWNDNNADIYGASSTETGAATVTMSWAFAGGADFAHIAFNIVAAAGTSSAAASSTGTGVATATGAASATSNFSAVGTSTTTAVGASSASSVASSDGTSTAIAVGNEIWESAASSDGISTAIAEGASSSTSEMSADGTSSAEAEGASTSEAIFFSEGTGDAQAVGEALADGSGDAFSEGSSTAEAVGEDSTPGVPGENQEASQVGVGGAWGHYSGLRKKKAKREIEREEKELIAIIEQMAPYIMQHRRVLH